MQNSIDSLILRRSKANEKVLAHLDDWLFSNSVSNVCLRPQRFFDRIYEGVRADPKTGVSSVSSSLESLCQISLANARKKIENSESSVALEDELKFGLACGFWALELQWGYDVRRGKGHERWTGLRGIDGALMLMLFACSAGCRKLARWSAAHLLGCYSVGSFSPLIVGERDEGAWDLIHTLMKCIYDEVWHDSAISIVRIDAQETRFYAAPLLARLKTSTDWRQELEDYCDVRLAHSLRRPSLDSSRSLRDNGLNAYLAERVPYLYLPLELTALRNAYAWLTGHNYFLDICHPVLPSAWVNLRTLRPPHPQFSGADMSEVLSELWDDELTSLVREAGFRWFGSEWQPGEVFIVSGNGGIKKTEQ